MSLIVTTYGEIDDSLLVKKEGAVETEHEVTTWVEYYREDELVHRSVHVTLKKVPVGMESVLQGFAK